MCERIGNYHTVIGNLDRAIHFFEKYRTISTELCRLQPDDEYNKNGLAISYQYLGKMHRSLGNLDKALGFFEKQNKLVEDLYADYPNNVGFKNGLASSYAKLGLFSRDNLKDKTKAKSYFEQAESLWLELVRDALSMWSFKRFWV